MKELYEKPEVSIVLFYSADIITVSGCALLDPGDPNGTELMG